MCMDCSNLTLLLIIKPLKLFIRESLNHQPELSVAECYGCQLVTKHIPPPPVKLTPIHQRPWEDLALDILGPLPSGENLLTDADLGVVRVVRSSPLN